MARVCYKDEKEVIIIKQVLNFIKQYKIWIIVISIVGLSGTVFALYQSGIFSSKEKQSEIVAPKSETAPAETKPVEVPKKAEKYYGFLMLGSDNGLHPGSDYTDSITYVAYSPEKNKAYSIPIYRDSLIKLTCGGEKNINHVYQDNGADCLMKSVSQLLNMPVDYYVYTSADAFVRVVDGIGGLAVTPNETFCSSSSLISGKKYCVNAGETYKMDGNMLLSYSRDRNHGNGVPRANRHQDVLASFARTCLSDIGKCSGAIASELNEKKIAHNLEIPTLVDIQKSVFKPTTTFSFVRMDALAGTNYADAAGSWHMAINVDSIVEKRAKVQADFGERTA